MKVSWIGPVLFAAGVFAGVVGVEGSMRASTVYAQMQATSQPMGQMAAKSKGDANMETIMNDMHKEMDGVHLTGDQDRDFMLLMIPHHASAVQMAKVQLQFGKRAELRALAKDIVASQGAEITKMKGWLKAWYGVSGTMP